MSQPFKDAVSLCKSIMRNGYDAYVINAPLQESLSREAARPEIEIASETTLEELRKIFPNAQEPESTEDAAVTAILEEGGVFFRFYRTDFVESAHPEATVTKVTPRLMKRLENLGEVPATLACPWISKPTGMHDGFAGVEEGSVRLVGIPDETLKRNYLLGVRALRFAANYQLPVDPNTWMAIVRNSQRILDYVPVSEIMDEWRKVQPENMWMFVRLLFDSLLLHGLVPELAGLSRMKHIKNDTGAEETVLEHTIDVMRRYPEELPYDWFGTLACLFHDVGKLFVGEYYDGKWHFHQHHRVGAKVTRKILGRLRLPPGEADLICHLVRHHMRFQYMLTDKGIRRFKALDEYPRLIEMARADVKARDGAYTFFNHNMKFLERADTPEELLEPLLNGNEIMEFTGLKPGPIVGIIRDALLSAQVAGEVTGVPEAVDYVRAYARREMLNH